ncbi:MAG: condensation domain-containing protein, partial [Waddliaceae bacterium]
MTEEYPHKGITSQEAFEKDFSPLTHAQQRIWLLEQLLPNKTLHNIPVILKIVGKLDLGILQKILVCVIKKHRSLRSLFVTSGESVFQKTQIPSLMDFSIPSVDLRHLKSHEAIKELDCLITEEIERPFNLTVGPLIRVKLVKTSNNESVLVLITHAIIFDRASEEILIKEISEIYENEMHGNATLIEVVEKPPEVNENIKQLHYWQKQLKEVPDLLQLPITKNRPAEPSFRTHFHTFYLSQSLRNSLTHTQLLSTLMLLLYRYSGQKDIVVGIPASRRINRIGCYENFLAIRASFDHIETFDDLVSSVHDTCQKAKENQDIPFELLVEKFNIKRVPNRHPIFQVALTINRSSETLNASGIKIERMEPSVFKSDLDLTLSISYMKKGLKVDIRYSSDLFDQKFGLRFEKHFRNIIDARCHSPRFSIRKLDFLSQEESLEILQDWNKTNVPYFPLNKTIHQLFEEQVERTPKAPAVYFNDIQMTYREFNNRSNQLAHFLINQHKIQPEDLVALCLERGEHMLIAIQGILKAGGAYVPIDPNFPIDRIQYILEDTQSPIIITQESYCHFFDKNKSLCIDSLVTQERLLCESLENPKVTIKSDNAAYILYTSGTSG